MKQPDWISIWIKSICICCVCVISFDKIQAQNTDSSEGGITITEPMEVTDIIKRHKFFMEEIETIEGYRVQIFSSSRLQETLKAKNRFFYKFSELKPYVVFTEPVYRLRIGDLKTRLEANTLMQKLLKAYPETFIVKDQISISAL